MLVDPHPRPLPAGGRGEEKLLPSSSPSLPRRDDLDLVAGLVIHEARSIPERGQSFTFHGFRFRVLRRERNRLTALRITPVTKMALRI